MDSHIWVGDSADQEWLKGGSYLVTRRIRMTIESWDRDRIGDQEAVIGRKKVSGAPLTGAREHDEPELTAKDRDGAPVIAVDAHIRLAAPETNNGAKLLRRGYSFTDGADPVTGQLDAGLFFICFNRDSRKQFVPMQQALSTKDRMMEYIRHTGSAHFAVPAGTRLGTFWGEQLFS